jgi:hypothetical protein
VNVKLGAKADGQAPSCLVALCGVVLNSHHFFPWVVVPRGDLPCPGGEGLSLCQKGLP